MGSIEVAHVCLDLDKKKKEMKSATLKELGGLLSIHVFYLLCFVNKHSN